MKKISIQKLACVALMSALVYTSSAFLQIPIPTALDSTRLHMGNVMCLLSGMLLGPVSGGIAAGIGSMFFDLTNPIYVTSAPFTFISKFFMAWLCAKLCRRDKFSQKTTYMISSTIASLSYVILYLAKSFIEQYFILDFELATVILTVAQKAMVSSLNAVFAVIASVTLTLALKPIINKCLNTYYM